MTLANILPQVIMVWIILLIVLYLILSKLEKRRWNHGMCPQCGKPWRYKSRNKKKKEYICVIIIISIILDIVRIIGKYSKGELKMFSFFFALLYFLSNILQIYS